VWNTLMRDGKIRYYGFSDVPAWYAARADAGRVLKRGARARAANGVFETVSQPVSPAKSRLAT